MSVYIPVSVYVCPSVCVCVPAVVLDGPYYKQTREYVDLCANICIYTQIYIFICVCMWIHTSEHTMQTKHMCRMLVWALVTPPYALLHTRVLH